MEMAVIEYFISGLRNVKTKMLLLLEFFLKKQMKRRKLHVRFLSGEYLSKNDASFKNFNFGLLELNF
jgi:hypothetical protein